jgi:hypothetical protein
MISNDLPLILIQIVDRLWEAMLLLRHWWGRGLGIITVQRDRQALLESVKLVVEQPLGERTHQMAVACFRFCASGVDSEPHTGI